MIRLEPGVCGRIVYIRGGYRVQSVGKGVINRYIVRISARLTQGVEVGPDNHGDKNVRSLNILFSDDFCTRTEINIQ